MAFVIMVIASLHVFYFSQKYFSFSERKYVFAQNSTLEFIRENQGQYRTWGIGSAFLENNFASQYGIFWPEGYDSLNNRSYGEFTYVMQGANIDDFVFRADAGLGRGNTVELLQNPNRRKLIDLVGVKYVIGKTEYEEILEKYNFKKVFNPSVDPKRTPGVNSSGESISVFDPTSPEAPRGENSYAVFENLTVMPRAFLASNYEGPPDIYSKDLGLRTKDEITRIERERRKLIPAKLLSGDFDFRNVLILEKPSPISSQFGSGTAQIINYKPTEVIIKTKSEQPKLLFISDNYYPGWKAKVDGDEVEMLRANYTFRAVPLTGGEHLVRFYYESEVFRIGLLITILSLGALGFFTLAKNPLTD